MIDVKNKKCTDCTKQPRYGRPGESPTKCSDHRETGMLTRPNSKCIIRRCTDKAYYGKSFPERCEAHHLEDDINLVEKNCTSCGQLYPLDVNGLCECCRPESFQRARLAKQRTVFAFLDARGLTGTQSDRMIDGGVCGRERPDRIYELPDRIIILEVDEHQHRERPCECEQIRMVNITEALGGMPVFWIRFNPDAYESPFEEKPVKHRYNTFERVLRRTLESQEMPVVRGQVVYLYFDGWKEGRGETKWEAIVT